MKKLLLLAAGAMLAASVAKADEAVIAPKVYGNYTIEDLSSNGEWAVSFDPFSYVLTVLNLKTGETWEYADETGSQIYMGGQCHYISDNGIVVGNYNDALGVYWENGQWNILNSKDTDYAVYANSVSLDGSVIGGMVSRFAMSLDDASEVMTVPVVWYRDADGTYGDYVELPYPHADFTGRVPQYVLLDAVSADGKIAAGCVTDYSGMREMPISFVQKDNGEWEYALVHPELLNPDNIEFPKYPGEQPLPPDPKDWMSDANIDAYDEALAAYQNRPYPQQQDYMTDEELAAYQEAYETYMADPYNNPYPFMSDFMTEEEVAAFNNAVSEYYAVPAPDPTEYMTANQKTMYEMALQRYAFEGERWNNEFYAFMEAWDEIMNNPEIPAFSKNSAIISPNGKYLGMTGMVYVEDPNSWFGFTESAVPYIFDLESGEYYIMDKGFDNVGAIQVSDNGWVLGATPFGDYTRKAVLAKGLEAGFVQLIDYVADQDADLYAWMKENMTHNIEDVDYVEDPETGEINPVVTVREEVSEGTTKASADFSVFAGWVVNNWDYMDENMMYSYVYSISGGLNGVNTVANKTSDFSINALRGGILSINGAVANVTVYDVTGRRVFTTDAPAGQIATGLSNGTYVVTAKAANGEMLTKKVAF